MHTHVVRVSGASWMHASPYQGSVQGFNGLKLMGPRGWLRKWLGWFLGFLLLMWKFYMVCFHLFHFLKVT